MATLVVCYPICPQQGLCFAHLHSWGRAAIEVLRSPVSLKPLNPFLGLIFLQKCGGKQTC